jgi:hypothetical protein
MDYLHELNNAARHKALTLLPPTLSAYERILEIVNASNKGRKIFVTSCTPLSFPSLLCSLLLHPSTVSQTTSITAAKPSPTTQTPYSTFASDFWCLSTRIGSRSFIALALEQVSIYWLDVAFCRASWAYRSSTLALRFTRNEVSSRS